MKNSPRGSELVALIDKSSQEKTVENLLKFEKADRDNYVYGLFYFQHPYYSYGALKRINVMRLGSSDLLRVKYSSGDPGIAYNTIEILMSVFVDEYRILRYGETDKVIAYFKSELNRIGAQLSREEDDLTSYNVQNKIINYYDETKEIAAINKEFELREQDILFAYNSSKAMLQELESQMLTNEKQALVSIEMLAKLKQASELTGKISEMETVSNEDADVVKLLNSYKEQLETARGELSSISHQYIGDKYSKNGLAKNTIIEQWLDQTLLYEKAKAELDIIRNSRNALNDKYEFFAPIGTTIKRKERLINFSEQGYLANLKSYNDALMRKKNLEMTSAALKVLNPPAYPITAESTNRKRLVLMACVGTFILLTAFFMVIELLDRTLRDSTRAKKLTKCPILANFPEANTLHLYNKECENIATKNLSSSLLSAFTPREPGKPYILNILSFGDNSDKDIVIKFLTDYWNSIGLNIRTIIEGVDFYAESADYMLATDVSQLISTTITEDILIVVHPEMSSCNIPTPLLKAGNLNMLVASAKYGWKAQDDTLLAKLEKQMDAKPYICLTDAPKYDIEIYTGMLPPYSAFRKMSYRLSQLSIGETIRQWKDYFTTQKKYKKEKSLKTTDDDN